MDVIHGHEGAITHCLPEVTASLISSCNHILLNHGIKDPAW